jgi:acyl-CoA reductase-like NAD-dependent aldehyde dehydrogenase
MYIGGNFVRSESGRFLPALSADGQALGNFAWGSRKDFRDAAVAARAAQAGWAKKTPYLRSQILYRAAEMLQSRSGELIREVSPTVDSASAGREVAAAIDRLVYYAGWADKYAQVFSSVNPVATSHFNFTSPEPTGVVIAICPETPALLPLVSLLAPVILSGNAVILLASERYPIPAITFSEILATSDLPGGVVNILTGKLGELASHFASHMDINAIVDASGSEELWPVLQGGSALNLKRYSRRGLSAQEWFGPGGEDPYWILDTVEQKTAWHPIGY